MTQMVTVKSTGLVKTGGVVRQLASRLERARQARNEKLARADAEYVDAVRRAMEAVSETDGETEPAEATAAADGDVSGDQVAS